MRLTRFLLLLLVTLLAACERTPAVHETQQIRINDMGIKVTAEENRPVSFTNKQAGFYYTQTHSNNHPEHSWFSGFSLTQKRIFTGYRLFNNGEFVDPKTALVTVYPHKLVRGYPGGLIETVQLFDKQDLIRIDVENATGELGIQLSGELVELQGVTPTFAAFSGHDDIEQYAVVTPINEQRVSVENNLVSTATQGKGFYIAVSKDLKRMNNVLSDMRSGAEEALLTRQQRMEQLLNGNLYFNSDDSSFDLALHWITLNLDQLLTEQRGVGLYAGLPWFSEYWGRDSFISFAGATLVSGQYTLARDMITAFAKFQNKERTSKFYGRVPNIVKADTLDYHTVDATPRLVIAMYDYLRYSGDSSLIEEMYPVVKRSIEGALAYWVDEQGYLLHADNETWMDARHAETKEAYSPRGNRANDVQALWFQQLKVGIYCAKFIQDEMSLQRWKKVAKKLKQHFEEDYFDPNLGYLADRLDKDGKPDFKLRPNQLFALDMLENDDQKIKLIKTVWQRLVYPWGVASLDNRDPLFHPYHLQPENYHKDSAYHNGTVWLWLNGIAMQRMVEIGQVEQAFRLFNNTSSIALKRGTVGGLAENSNAYPKESEVSPQLTGTYLQAWSNAEHLRVWYQYFLGVRPDLVSKRLMLAPRIPKQFSELSYSSLVGAGKVKAEYTRNQKSTVYQYHFDSIHNKVVLDLPDFDMQYFNVNSGDELLVKVNSQGARVQLTDRLGGSKQVIELHRSEVKLRHQQNANKLMEGIDFAKPIGLENHLMLKN